MSPILLYSCRFTAAIEGTRIGATPHRSNAGELVDALFSMGIHVARPGLDDEIIYARCIPAFLHEEKEVIQPSDRYDYSAPPAL